MQLTYLHNTNNLYSLWIQLVIASLFLLKVNLSFAASYFHYIDTFGGTIRHLNKYFNVENRKFETNTLKDSPNQLAKNLANEIIYLSDLLKKKNLIF